MTSLIVFAAKYLIIVPVAAILVLWLKEPRETRTRFFLVSLASFALAYVLAKIAGHLYFDPRPFVSDNIVPLIPHTADNGFPSDHTLLASAIASVATVFNRRAGYALWVVAFLIGAARVMAGIHHPVDILGSMIIAAIATWLVAAFINVRSN